MSNAPFTASADRLFARYGSELSYQELVTGTPSGAPIMALSRTRPIREDTNAGLQSGMVMLSTLAVAFTAVGKRLDEGVWETTLRGKPVRISQKVETMGPDPTASPIYYRAMVAT